MENQENFTAFEQPTTPPENNMTLAIVGTVLGLCSPCCVGLITGIIAIVFATQVNTKFQAGDHAGAVSSAKNVKTLSYISIALGVLGIIITIVQLIAYGGIGGYMEMIETYQREMGL